MIGVLHSWRTGRGGGGSGGGGGLCSVTKTERQPTFCPGRPAGSWTARDTCTQTFVVTQITHGRQCIALVNIGYPWRVWFSPTAMLDETSIRTSSLALCLCVTAFSLSTEKFDNWSDSSFSSPRCLFQHTDISNIWRNIFPGIRKHYTVHGIQ